jgi:hypothetical protein
MRSRYSSGSSPLFSSQYHRLTTSAFLARSQLWVCFFQNFLCPWEEAGRKIISTDVSLWYPDECHRCRGGCHPNNSRVRVTAPRAIAPKIHTPLSSVLLLILPLSVSCRDLNPPTKMDKPTLIP